MLTEKEFNDILSALFEAPKNLSKEADLRAFITDSIDVGELIAFLKHERQIQIEASEFKSVYCFSEVLDLINKYGRQ